MTSSFNLDSFLEKAVKTDSSDIHLKVGERPMLRRDGLILKVEMPALTRADMEQIVNNTVPDFVKNKLAEATDLDYSYNIPGIARFRVNLSRSLNEYSLVFRIIPYAISNFEKLHLPVAMQQFADYNNGIVLVTGPTGSGKSTTLASFIDYINSTYQKHIITVEDPVEFVFTDKKCKITQRQVGIDTTTFAAGIKYALRQDPDVILVGEIRDIETLDSALKAAETGHLVFSTLHTNDAVQTIYRIINMYNPEDRETVRRQLAQTLRGTIAQKLVKKAVGKGRYPACEMLVVTPTVKDFILKDEIDSIYDAIKNGSYNDMFSMNASLHKLVEIGAITKETALEASDDKNELEQFFRGVYRGTKNGDLYE
ncbi:PilT/PilU family type 4a pilus ATPase [bacterium]|nr:PilT/PilU family type 4a pilus ATPase [bacterium]